MKKETRFNAPWKIVTEGIYTHIADAKGEPACVKKNAAIVRAAPELLFALEKIRDINEGDLAKYCAKVDAIACEALAQYEASA